MKSLFCLIAFALPLIVFGQVHRDRQGDDYSKYKVEDRGKSRHSSLDHEKFKKIAKKRKASYYSYTLGTTSYRRDPHGTFNTGNPIYKVSYYNLIPFSKEEIEEIERKANQKDFFEKNTDLTSVFKWIETDTTLHHQFLMGSILCSESVYIKDEYLKQNSPKTNDSKKGDEKHKSLISFTVFDMWGSGKKTLEERYRNGKPHGVWKEWNDNGDLILEQIYEDGKLISEKKM